MRKGIALRGEAGNSEDQHNIPAEWMYPAGSLRSASGAVFQGMGKGYRDRGNGAGRENPRRWLALHVAGGLVLVASTRQNGRNRDPPGIGTDSSCGEGTVQCCRAGFHPGYEVSRLPPGQSNSPGSPDTKSCIAELIRENGIESGNDVRDYYLFAQSELSGRSLDYARRSAQRRFTWPAFL